MSDRHVAVVGGGAWGTALSIHMASRGHPVRLWIRERDLVARVRARRDNPLYLPGIRIPQAVRPVEDPVEAVDGASLILTVVPSPFAREVYRRLSGGLRADALVLVATKGIESPSLALPIRVVSEELGAERPVAVLSGPSFASEVARGLPAAVVVAARDPGVAARLQETVSGGNLRVYTNPDPVGVQVAGALKNVIAIAAGVVDGLGLGRSTMAALVTRGLVEIRRLGVALGGQAETFSGLAGMGDLVLTCTGELSRNRRVGQALGRGERLADALASTPAVPEGVGTTRAARDLARRCGVEMPIVDEVHGLLYEEATPAEAVARLMNRPLTSESGDLTETVD